MAAFMMRAALVRSAAPLRTALFQNTRTMASRKLPPMYAPSIFSLFIKKSGAKTFKEASEQYKMLSPGEREALERERQQLVEERTAVRDSMRKPTVPSPFNIFMAEYVKQKLASGEASSATDAVQHGLREAWDKAKASGYEQQQDVVDRIEQAKQKLQAWKNKHSDELQQVEAIKAELKPKTLAAFVKTLPSLSSAYLGDLPKRVAAAAGEKREALSARRRAEGEALAERREAHKEAVAKHRAYVAAAKAAKAQGQPMPPIVAKPRKFSAKKKAIKSQPLRFGDLNDDLAAEVMEAYTKYKAVQKSKMESRLKRSNFKPFM